MFMMFIIGLILSTTVPIEAWQPVSRTAGRSLRDVSLRSATTTSERLDKARTLLEQYTATEANEGENLLSAVSTAPQSSSNNVVPDGLWLNGHLQSPDSSVGPSSNDLVTRWSQGVKVAEPLVKYDPVATAQQLFRQPTKWLVRNFQIALPIGWWAVGVVYDYVGNKKGPEQRRMRAKQLTNAISSLGPAIIKGGQALASRPDLLPAQYLEELQNLQDNVPRFSNQLALQTVEKELGQPFEDIFELVQTEPVAAASIGQVYKARLKANGDLVALKIQRPDCEQVIALDLYVLRWWSGVYNKIFELLQRDINVQSIIDDFGELIYREIDYVAEAANAQRFQELYASVRDVFVPKIYSDLTTAKVLTMEWVDGARLTDRQQLKEWNLHESQLVDTLVQCSLQQVLENGLFHADPHAGNLLACPDGRLCYLDFGMMSYATKEQRNGFLLAVVHIVNRDWDQLCELYVKLGFIPQGTDLKPIRDALEDALPNVLDSDITQLNFKNVISELGDIMYLYPFSLPPFYIAIIRCLGVLEGLAIQVDPQARIIAQAYPYVASRVLTDPQPDLKQAFQGLALTKDGQVRWDRLEGLLEEAQTSQGYDVALALDVLTDYMIADENNILPQVADQLVRAADDLGTETLEYVVEAARALVIRDEVAAVRAIRSIQSIVSQQDWPSARDTAQSSVLGALPEPSPSMQGFSRIFSALLGAADETVDTMNGETLAKLVPVVRKLSQDPKIQRTANEVLARLGERFLSRGLRAVFGLSPEDTRITT